MLATLAVFDPASYGRLELARRNGLRLLRLVNSLLDFSWIEAGRVQATYESTDFAAFIASSSRSTIEKAGLTFRVSCVPLGEPVYLDRDIWEKILMNLLSNAFKHTFGGEIAVEIRRSADGRHAEALSIDMGIGVAANQLPKLFERFHRIEGARGRGFEGTGIGLALLRGLVTLHGGSNGVESEPRARNHVPDHLTLGEGGRGSQGRGFGPGAR